ncbi:penicillin-binding protein [Bifidobacterium rousetti]|uniref:transglycosylase domain-containing protein n=1 Tax=Bifidobacterium rousetti TaxID=2045439 RepID=UPI00123B4E50|nr:transglycosylase domain-containing protein [Bifidobacterium rousetti]KAA8819129.1 penicillin-binding protein [Bifidobacterium rousetti]
MVSHSRNVRKHARRAAQGRSVRGSDRTPAARHYRGGNHRAKGGNGPRMRGRSRHLILKWALGLIAAGLAAGIGLFTYLYVTTEIPQPEKIAMASNTTVYFNDGTTEMGTFSDQNREIIDCAVLPDYVGNAIVASENRSFYTDRGIDLQGIARALVNNVTKGTRQGGSTITQQYAERYYLGETTSYTGKLHEAILALKIAQSQDKAQVLCNYMNTIYLGRGSYGIQAAAQAYFNKDAKDLTVSEAAMLAGIIPAPSTWDPAQSPKMAEQRFHRVISIMKEDGYITSQEASSAAMPTTVENKQQDMYKGPNGYLLQMVRDELVNSKAFTKDDLDTGGYKIVTTIDKSKQDLMQQVVSPASNGMQGVVPDGMQFGAMSANPKDGSIIALYAGDDYLTKQLNNATQAQYEVGSTMKPFALMGAVQSKVSLNTIFNGNSKRTFPGIAGTVSNVDGENLGYINLYKATAQSSNTVFMDLQTKLGTKKIAQIAREAGVQSTSLDGSEPYTVLGNNALTVKDMTWAYSTLANQGNKPTLHIVASVKDTDNKDLYKAPTSTTKVFEANDANLVTKALTGVVQSGTATEARSIGHTIAGKSGTSNNSYAASFVGYTPSVVSTFAMWYPDANGNPQEIPRFGRWTGRSDYPIHLFTQYMKQALAGTANETFPTAKDNGKVGGSDGTWGTGSSSSSKYYGSSSSGSSDSEGDTQDGSTDSAQSGQTGENGAGGGSGSGTGNGTGSGSNGSGTGTGGTTGGTGSGNGTQCTTNPNAEGCTGSGGSGDTPSDEPSNDGDGPQIDPAPNPEYGPGLMG